MLKIKIIFILIILILSGCSGSRDNINNMENNEKEFNSVHQPAVAGQFYPMDASRLKKVIKNYINDVPEQKVNGGTRGVIVPHAGYDFSAPVAAYSYKLLENKKVNTAVIICNSHTTYFSGIAVDESDAWQTPLGLVEVDKELAEKLVKYDKEIEYNSEVHKTDHTLEVQIPILQTMLKGNFKIVPILFGNSNSEIYKKLAEALAKNLGKDDIVIISTDMSHYPSYEDAKKIDQQTLEMIKTGDISKLETHIENIDNQNISNEQTLLCGIDGVKTGIELFNLMNWDEIKILNYANSGDVSIGSKDSVVGYGAAAFIENQTTSNPSLSKEGEKESHNKNELNIEQKEKLLNIARFTVENYVRDKGIPEFEISDERLGWKEGAFVTLHKNGDLRGCIGQIIPSDSPLWEVVRDMAIAACSEDHRFNPVSEEELEGIDYEVSILSVPEKIDNWEDIELGKHGVIVKKGFRSGVFLPQVATETGWTLEEFLSQLCSQKAGLSPDCYQNKDVELEVFTAQVFSEKDIR